MRRIGLGVLVWSMVWCAAAVAAHAQVIPKFDPANYATLASADSAATIPIGTKITLQNWQQYRQFLPPEFQWVLEKKLPWPPIPSDWEVEVGPDVQVQAPKTYRDETEKHSGQVRLAPTPAGGWALQNYVAGQPFPQIDPKDPQVGIKILYNFYYKYYPWCSWSKGYGTEFDRFGNETTTGWHEVYTRVKHVGDPGVPIDRGIGGNYDFTEWVQSLVPEQSKYTTLLSIFYDDPARVEERYAFVPALRRTLRLSATSRCAPFQGTDFLNEDAKFGFNGQPPFFKVTYLGHKKVLVLRNYNIAKLHDTDHNLWGPIAFPKPSVGAWQVHSVYIIDLVRLPAYATGYCYNHRVMFMDPEAWTALWVMDYDAGDKLWKILNFVQTPTKLPDGTISEGWVGQVSATAWDVQVMHSSLAQLGKGIFNDRCGKYVDPTLYVLPAGLTRINR